MSFFLITILLSYTHINIYIHIAWMFCQSHIASVRYSRMRCLWLAFSLLLATAPHGHASPDAVSGLDYLVQLAASTCSQAGQVICSLDCNEVILCVSDGEGSFQSVPMETCSADSSCSAEQRSCVAGGSACGSALTGGITCHAKGLFPDPHNCTAFHVCLAENVQSIAQTCEPGYAYNALTKECSYRTTDSVCTEGPIPQCKSAGQSGALATNPSIYYVCTSKNNELTPSLYKCAHGYEYDYATYSCVDPNPPTPPPPSPGAACSPPGEIEPDLQDCSSYYECATNGTWLHIYCGEFYFFNWKQDRCVMAGCPADWPPPELLPH